MDRTIQLREHWARIWARRKAITTLVVATTLVVGVIAFIMPPWYRADAELLPPGEEDSGFGLASLLRGMSVPGVRIPTQVSTADVLMVILESRRVGEQMVVRFDLQRVYKKKFMVDAIKELHRHSRFKLTQAGSVEISVEDRDRKRAADMANAYVEFLDLFNRQVRMTKGRRTRLFIETRLAENKRELAVAEHRLAQYQATHKAIVLSPEMSSAVEEAARLNARRMSLEVRLGVVRNYSQGSEEEIQLVQELAQIDRQMKSLPATGLELVRLMRDVKALEGVFALLTAQYEDARITEARDLVTVETLDVATPPEKKARPQRTLMMGAAFLLSLVVGAGLALRGEQERAIPLMRAVSTE